MSGALDRRLAALADAVELADGRLEDEPVAAARAVVGRAGERLRLGVEQTVVALAGPTGAGKSSLFNALARAPLVAATARRPTTAQSTAAVWGAPPDALLDWLGVPLRHAVADGRFDGLVLLDLPDFDSVERRHRLEVDRVLALVDLLVWVVDPQKYADAVLHEQYLRPHAAHREAMLVVLNQADALAPAALEACRADLGRLLARDGLDGTPVLPLSARTGDGLPELEQRLRERVERRQAAVARLSADVGQAAGALAVGCEPRRDARVGRAPRERLVAALAGAAGVPTVVQAVERSHRRSGALATGWPPVRWLRRLRPDPLRRLGLASDRPAGDRLSLPGPTPLQRSGADSALRALAADAAVDLPAPWPALARSAATRREGELADRLDRAVAGVELGRGRPPRWWAAAALLQRGLALVAGVGLAWLGVLVLLGLLQLGDAAPLPDVEGVPLPTALLAGGGLAGLLLAALTRLVNGAAARRRARRAGRALSARIEEQADELVIEPVEAELEARRRLCSELARALKGGA